MLPPFHLWEREFEWTIPKVFFRDLFIGKDPDAGKDWRQEKAMTEDKMVGWHHRLNGHQFEQAPGAGDGQGGLACCSPWGCKESDMTELTGWTLTLTAPSSRITTYLFQWTWVPPPHSVGWPHLWEAAGSTCWKSCHCHHSCKNKTLKLDFKTWDNKPQFHIQ